VVSSDIVYTYTFRLADGTTPSFSIVLDPRTLALKEPVPDVKPAWTELPFHQCPTCPLPPDDHGHCPAALAVVPLIDFLFRADGDTLAEVTVGAPARTYQKRVPIRVAMSSLLGLRTAASGCPVMGKLRPLVRFHLPFATTEETQFRSISMYLFAQYLRMKAGRTPDWEMKEYEWYYQELRVTNEHFHRRLQAGASSVGADALTLLNLSAQNVVFLLDAGMMDELTASFMSHMQE